VHLSIYLYIPILRASLSGTFLQTLPDLVTPLKGTLYLRAAVHRRGQRPPKGSGTDKTVEANLAPKHARKHETHPPRVKKIEEKKSSVSIQTILVLFELA